jgi:hypothetical protein
VLDIMSQIREANKQLWLPGRREIKVIGIANVNARRVEPYQRFPDLCTEGCFLGIRKAPEVRLRALGDIEEYAISELLDALVVAAALESGCPILHEDGLMVGPLTGPWQPSWT